METTTLAAKAQDQLSAAIKQARDAAIAAVSQVSETLGNVLPEFPRTPLSERLPDPAEVVTTSFAFAEQILEAQKAYALELLKAMAPVTGKLVPAANRKPVRRSATAKA
jgi:ABC-type transporter Mla subunit MlaD